MLGADKYNFGKLVEDMKNDILRKKNPFQNGCRSMPCTVKMKKSLQWEI